MHALLIPAAFVLWPLALQEGSVGTADRTARESRTFEFTYTAELAGVPPGARRARLWIPIPQDSADQEIEALRVEASDDFTIQALENGQGRSLCVTSPGAPIRVRATFVVTRRETRGGGTASPDELARARRADRLVPLDGKVAAVAASLKVPAGDPRAVARELYLHTLEHMSYDKPAGGQWGRGDAEWACDSRYGNCTDFHSYFMGLARAKGIPARFEMGFPIPGGDEELAEVGGYHCWAFFWDDERGWVPVDISEADKHAELAEYYFGTLDPDRVTMTGGRDLWLSPRQEAGPVNFFVYPYAEVDGVEWTKVEKRFTRRNL